MKLYICQKCGSLKYHDEKSGEKPICCNEVMSEVPVFEGDASIEKHLPIYKFENNKAIVNVSDIEHPMTEEHFIQWIAIETANGFKKKNLTSNDKPYAEFELLDNEKVIAAYAYCNLHGLWVANY